MLRSGEKNTVFVALDGGKFEPRTVVLGAGGENGHVSGPQRLERRRTRRDLRPVHARFGKPVARGDSKNARADADAETAAASPTTASPMHQASPAREYQNAWFTSARCRSTSPSLTIIRAIARFAAWRSCRSRRANCKKLQPGGKVLYYTCPMPEHSDVHEDKPGKCPICGMTLIPVMDAPKPALQTNAALNRCRRSTPAPCTPSGLDKPGTCPMQHGAGADQQVPRQNAEDTGEGSRR